MSLQSTITNCFESVVLLNPTSPALIYKNIVMSYDTLNCKANQLAHYIQHKYCEVNKKALKPGTFIGIYLSRGFNMIVAMMAIMKVGCAYVPLEPDYPDQRLQDIIKDCELPICIVEQLLLPHFNGIQIDLDKILAHIEKQPCENLNKMILSESIAYLIYTSGTTGKPKGVMIKHDSVCNMIQWAIQQYPINKTDRIIQIASFMFDLSVWEIASALLSGAALVLTQPMLFKDPSYLINIMSENNVSIIGSTPALLHLLFTHPKIKTLSQLRLVLSCAAPLTHALQQLIHQCLPVRVYNGYGPTETTIMVTHWLCPPNHSPSEPILLGKPIQNIQIVVLDKNGKPTNLGEIGTLYIGGIGVCAGYLNDERLNNEHFIMHETEEKKAFLFNTGDRVRVLFSGDIEFIGRNDFQVKLRGYRVEFEDIVNNILHFPDITQCVVTLQTINMLDYLVAYVITKKDAALDKTALRVQLKKSLPEYMIPSYFIKISSFPLTQNGKINREQLPAPTADARW